MASSAFRYGLDTENIRVRVTTVKTCRKSYHSFTMNPFLHNAYSHIVGTTYARCGENTSEDQEDIAQTLPNKP